MNYLARLTVDMHREEHIYIKIASALLDVSMREFILLATFEKMEKVHDEWLSKKAKEILAQLNPAKKNDKCIETCPTISG